MSLDTLRAEYPWPDRKPELEIDDHGWCHDSIRDGLAKLVTPDMDIIIELGSWLGQSARLILSLAPRAAVVCVDHWKGSAEHRRNPDWKRRLTNLYEQFLANMWEHRGRIVPVKDDSVAGLSLIQLHGIAPDLIYIDASHDSPAVCKDIVAAATLFPRVPLMGDDWQIGSVREGVWRAHRDPACRLLPVRRHEGHWWSLTHD